MQVTRIKSDLYAATLNTCFLAVLLIYLDEGFTNFEWTREVWNWFILLGYVILIFPTQYLMSKYMFNAFSGTKKILVVTLFGFPMTIFLFWMLFRKLTAL